MSHVHDDYSLVTVFMPTITIFNNHSWSLSIVGAGQHLVCRRSLQKAHYYDLFDWVVIRVEIVLSTLPFLLRLGSFNLGFVSIFYVSILSIPKCLFWVPTSVILVLAFNGKESSENFVISLTKVYCSRFFNDSLTHIA